MRKDLLTLIKHSNETDINKLVEKKIELAKKEARRVNRKDCKFFGINFEKSPNTAFTTNFSWLGFIDNDIKVGFGLEYEGSNQFTDKGSYYYLDDEEYIYDFAKYIKDKDVETFEDFVKYLGIFLNEYLLTEKYYNSIETNTREDMYTPILDITGEKYYEPIRKHTIMDFYANEIASCMEYTTLAQNILSVFGYRTYAILGSFIYDKTDGFHAFNIIDFDKVNTLVDFSYQVKRFNINGDMIPSVPFVVDLDDEQIKKIENKEQLDFNEKEIININGKDIYIDLKDTRSYIPFRCKYYDLLEKHKIKVKYE